MTNLKRLFYILHILRKNFLISIISFLLTFAFVACGDSVNVEAEGNGDDSNKIYEIGDIGPGGGIIFYINIFTKYTLYNI